MGPASEGIKEEQMRWVQLLLLVIVLELGVIAIRMPTPFVNAQMSGPVPACIVADIHSRSCLSGNSIDSLHVAIDNASVHVWVVNTFDFKK
jgi:hypothetical protein